MGFLPYVLLVMVPGILLSLWAAYRVRSTYSKWQKVDSGISMNAFDFARYLLNSQGLTQVSVESTLALLDGVLPARCRAERLDLAPATTVAGSARDPR